MKKSNPAEMYQGVRGPFRWEPGRLVGETGGIVCDVPDYTRSGEDRDSDLVKDTQRLLRGSYEMLRFIESIATGYPKTATDAAGILRKLGFDCGVIQRQEPKYVPKIEFNESGQCLNKDNSGPGLCILSAGHGGEHTYNVY